MKIFDRKGKITAGILLALFIVFFTGSSASAAQVNGMIKGNHVEVRAASPSGSAADKTVSDTLNTGHAVTVLGERPASQNEDRNRWLEIEYVKDGSSKKGWVRYDFVDTSGSALIGNGVECYTDVEDIPVYSDVSKIPGNMACRLGADYAVTVSGNGVVAGSDHYSYYYVTFEAPENYKNVTGGYIRMDHLTMKDPFQAGLEDAGFPKDYAKLLQEIHEVYPKWKFEAVYVGEGARSAYGWEDVLAAESVRGVNQHYSESAAASLFGRLRRIGLTLEASMLTENLEEAKTDTLFEDLTGGGWVNAPKELTAYYLDPRNFLTLPAVDNGTFFQFESLSRESFQTKSGVEKILSGTFMEGVEVTGARTYADVFMEAGDTYGVSPYHLAARVRQEQGVKGESPLISGTYKGYENLYNYYNVQASGSSPTEVVVNGLKYAGGSDSETLRPWNTRYKALMGGSKFVASRYVKCRDYTPAKRYAQDTLYFQKFNVTKHNGTVVQSHQYMQNVGAPSEEAVSLKRTHTASELKNGELVFKIPVYADMPEEPCPRPNI